MVLTDRKIDHVTALQKLRERLVIIQGSPFPEYRVDEITRIKSVIGTYSRLYHSEIIYARMEAHGA